MGWGVPCEEGHGTAKEKPSELPFGVPCPRSALAHPGHGFGGGQQLTSNIFSMSLYLVLSSSPHEVRLQ